IWWLTVETPQVDDTATGASVLESIQQQLPELHRVGRVKLVRSGRDATVAASRQHHYTRVAAIGQTLRDRPANARAVTEDEPAPWICSGLQRRRLLGAWRQLPPHRV